MEAEQHKKKKELLEVYIASLQPIEDALHLALLETGEAVKSKKHYQGAIWRAIGVNLEKKSVISETHFDTKRETILEPVPNGKMKLHNLLLNDELSIKELRIFDFSLYGVSGLLRIVDVYRMKHIFKLCRNILSSSNNFPIYKNAGKKISGMINVVTSVFGDAVLHREVNPHPSSIHVYRVFIASATSPTIKAESKCNSIMIEAVVSAICNELFNLKMQGTAPETRNSLFGISLSTQMALNFDSSVPFMFLDRFLSLEKLKLFVKRILFSPNSRGSDSAELVLNAFLINNFDHTTENISDLPHIFPVHIHYSWALVKPSSTNEVLSTVLHGGQPPLSLLFSSLFDNLAALQSYLRLYDSPQSVNSLSQPNSVSELREIYQRRLEYFASNRSMDNLFDLSMSILVFGSTIGPPITFSDIDGEAQRQLTESVSKFFSSNSSAYRALVNYGLSLGLVGSRFIGVNAISSSENGKWYKEACKNFAERIYGFFGEDRIHYRTVPTADSAVVANLLITTADALMANLEYETPLCKTGLPNIISGITLYCQVYWTGVSTATALNHCQYLLNIISNLRNSWSNGYSTDQSAHDLTKPLSIDRVVSRFMNYPEPKSTSGNMKSSANYLIEIMKQNFHTEFAEITKEMLVASVVSTPLPLGQFPDSRKQATNDAWLSHGARLAKVAAARSFGSTSDGVYLKTPSRRHKRNLPPLGAHPAVKHHFSHCKGCSAFISRILSLMQFVVPKSHYPSCFKPMLAVNGSSALRCFYDKPYDTFMMAPVYLSQIWLPASPDVELVAAPLDSIAETVAKHLSSLCVHGTPVQIMGLRFVVLSALNSVDEEDLSCYEIPPVDVALPVALRDLYGCAMELHRWWSVSSRHRIFIRGVINITGPPDQLSLSPDDLVDHNPCFVEFFVDIRPCFSSDMISAFRPFDRISNVFFSEEEYKHFEQSFVRIASVNDSSAIGFGVTELENAVSMATFFNYPLVPFAQLQVDIDIHSRYAVAMASSNWLDAIMFAHWHAILMPLANANCNCALINVEALFRDSMTYAPLLRLPYWLKGLSSLAVYCRDSIIMALNFSSVTNVEASPEALIGPFSMNKLQLAQENGQVNFPLSDDGFCDFEITLIQILSENVRIARNWSVSKRTTDPDTVFSKEPTGYSAVFWANAIEYIYHALHCISPDGEIEKNHEIRWQNIVDQFSGAAHDMSKLAALSLGYCDTIAYYNLFANENFKPMIRKVSQSCTCESFNLQLLPVRGIFRQDVVSLAKTMVNE